MTIDIKGGEQDLITLQCDWKGIFDGFTIREHALLSFWLPHPDVLIFIIKVERYVAKGEPLLAIPEQMFWTPPAQVAGEEDGGCSRRWWFQHCYDLSAIVCVRVLVFIQ